jgi:hypothetical protein
MNIVYKKASALVFSVIVTTSAYGIENDNMTDTATQPVASVAWYKKGSVQAAAVTATLAVIGYVFAVRTCRVMLPAFMTSVVTENSTQSNEGTTNSQISDDIQVVDASNDVQLVAEKTVDTALDFDVKKMAEKFVAEATKVVSSEKKMKKIFEEL